MRMWSQGLGKNELVVDFKNYKVVEEISQDNVKETVVRGITNEPVQWEFQARICEEDFSGFMNIFFKPATLFFALKNIHRIILFFFQKLFRKEQFAELDIK